MPNSVEILNEIQSLFNSGNRQAFDVTRRKYLDLIAKYRNRNVIAYYSGWLDRPKARLASVNDKDVTGFMANIHTLDRSKGLDLILHTPGGDIAATEAIVNYLKQMFGNDIVAIVPQIAMSAGTMMAFSCQEIIMGKQSSLGPTDPQINGMPCQAVVSEFDEARVEILENPNSSHLWQFILSKYHPTLLSACRNAIELSDNLITEWLKTNMFESDIDKALKIAEYFSSHQENKTHGRHVPIQRCQELGLKIKPLEENQEFQDHVLSAHHAFMHTFGNSKVVKIIENHLGVGVINGVKA